MNSNRQLKMMIEKKKTRLQSVREARTNKKAFNIG